MNTLLRIKKARLKRDEDYEDANARLGDLIEQAHDEGASWSTVAGAMDLTRQGLGLFRERHGKNEAGR